MELFWWYVLKTMFLLVVTSSQTKTKVQKANSVISYNNIITSYHLSCICCWKWNRLVKDDPGCFEKKLFYKIQPRIFWNSVAGKKTLRFLRLEGFQNCVHVLYAQNKGCNVIYNTCLYVHCKSEMYVINSQLCCQ